MTREELQVEWVNFCTSKANVAKETFYTLFHGKLTREDIRLILSFVEEGDELCRRVMNVLTEDHGMYSFERPTELGLDRGEIINRVERAVSTKRDYCLQMGDQELANILSNPNFEFTENLDQVDEFLMSDIPHHWIVELINDAHIDAQSGWSEVHYALSEALIGLVHNYAQLHCYLIAPMLKISYDSQSYYESWKSGYDYLVLEDKVLVYKASSIAE